jgi:hypothetical protein
MSFFLCRVGGKENTLYRVYVSRSENNGAPESGVSVTELACHVVYSNTFGRDGGKGSPTGSRQPGKWLEVKVTRRDCADCR